MTYEEFIKEPEVINYYKRRREWHDHIKTKFGLFWRIKYRFKHLFKKVKDPIMRYLLKKIIGKHAFGLLLSSVASDLRCTDAHMIDIIIRKDAIEKRLQADWYSHLAKAVL